MMASKIAVLKGAFNGFVGVVGVVDVFDFNSYFVFTVFVHLSSSGGVGLCCH